MGQAGPVSADGDEDRVELPWKPTKNALQGLWDPGPATGISDIHSHMLGPTVAQSSLSYLLPKQSLSSLSRTSLSQRQPCRCLNPRQKEQRSEGLTSQRKRNGPQAGQT